MKSELIKTDSKVFNNYYVGINGNKKVTVILDLNCIRYTVVVNGKLISKKEYQNGKQDMCLKRALAELNK